MSQNLSSAAVVIGALRAIYRLYSKCDLFAFQFQPYIRINRACTASACMGLISPRDFVDVVTTRETDEGISTNGISLPFLSHTPSYAKMFSIKF